MKIFNSLEEYQPHESGVNAALGFFDGVHPGHRAVVGAGAGGELPCTVLTFRDSPAKALGRTVPPALTDNARKAALLAEAGADEVIFADFGALRELSPEAFVQQVLAEKLRARRVYCGFNYRFGKGGAGDVALLKALCDPYGVGVIVSEPVLFGGEQVSSSRIRACIAGGDIARANAMLGYRYAVAGRITDGNHLGTVMGFPTVNIPIPKGQVIPRFGVYASRVTVGEKTYQGATNIGVHPTVGANSEPLCETFLLDFDGGELRGKQAVCELIKFIRPEMTFGSAAELSEQIKKDIKVIRQTEHQEGDWWIKQ